MHAKAASTRIFGCATASWFLALILVLGAGTAECGDVRAGGLQASFRGVRNVCDGSLVRPNTLAAYCGGNWTDISGHNLLTDRTEFDDWIDHAGSCVVTPDVRRNPVDGTLDVDLLDSTAGGVTDARRMNIDVGVTGGRTFTFSVWVVADVSHNITLRLYEWAGDGTLDEYTAFLATTQPQRLSITGIATGTTTTQIAVFTYPGELSVSTGKAYFYGAQLVECNQSPCPMGRFINPPDQSVTKPDLSLTVSGTPSRSVSSFQGVDGNRVESRSLNGTTDFGSVPHHDSMNINDSDHVYTFVFKQDVSAAGQDMLFSHAIASTAGLYIYSNSSSGMYAVYQNGVGGPVWTDNAFVPNDGRYHIAQLVSRSGIAVLNIDGVAGNPIDVSSHGADGSAALYLGAYGGASLWEGDIAYTRIDAKALSPDELARDREILTGLVSSLTAVPREDVIVDGDMEAVGVAAWGVGNNAVLTKETGSPFSGAQVLRITRGGASTQPVAVQLIWTIGNTYRIVGRARGDGTNHPALYGSGGVGLYWTGISSTSWQHFDEILTVPHGTFYLMAVVAAAGYAEFDDVYVIEYSPSIASFTRASTAMQTFSDGSMASVAANMPRVGDGLPVEGEGENLCLQSKTFDTTWTKTELTSVTSDGMTAPDGTVTMDGLVGDADNESHGIWQLITLTAAVHTFSVYAKPGDQDWIYLVNAHVPTANAYFDLSTGQIGNVGVGATAGIELYSDGVSRCWITYTGLAGANTHHIYVAVANGNITFAGDAVTVNTWLWESQVEPGTFPTSPITTTTIPVTREPDLISWDPHPPNSTEVIIPEEFNPGAPNDKLTVYLEAKCQWSGIADMGVNREILGIGGNAGTASVSRNYVQIYGNSNGRIYGRLRDDSDVDHWAYTGVDIIAYDEWFSLRFMIDFSDLGRMTFHLNESESGITYSGNSGTATFDTVNTLIRVGQTNAGIVNGNCHIRNVRINNKEIRP